jgi:hypothetical protein
VNTPSNTVEPTKSYTFEAVPEDEETQEQLNRRLRKPGEPGYDTSPKSSNTGTAQPASESKHP